MRRASVLLSCAALVVGFGLSWTAQAAPAGQRAQEPSWLDSRPLEVCVNTERPAPSQGGKGQALFLETICTGSGNTRIPGCCERRSDFCTTFCAHGIRRFTCVEVQNGCSSYCGCNPPPV